MSDEDDYPPYPPNVVCMARQAHEDGKRQSEMLVIVVAGIVAGVALGLLLVVYGFVIIP